MIYKELTAKVHHETTSDATQTSSGIEEYTLQVGRRRQKGYRERVLAIDSQRYPWQELTTSACTPLAIAPPHKRGPTCGKIESRVAVLVQTRYANQTGECLTKLPQNRSLTPLIANLTLKKKF
jgi:hypothetical protein